ncbi:MAG: FkbM family methyltransferase [Hyphomicrobiaceae bacterium]
MGQLDTVRFDGTQFLVERGNPHAQDFWRDERLAGWEPDTIAFINRTVTPGTWFLDVGAWIGPTALIASRRAERVIAFEPDPIAHAQIVANFAANGVAGEVHQAAIDKTSGKLDLFSVRGAGSSCTSVLDREGAGESFSVPTMTLQQMAALVPPDKRIVTKIDIEGHEYNLADDIVAHFDDPRVRAMHLSLHPGVIWRAGRDGRTAARGRLELWRATMGLVGRLARNAILTPGRGYISHKILTRWTVGNLTVMLVKHDPA